MNEEFEQIAPMLCIRDIVAEYCMPPFVAATVGAGVKDFYRQCNREDKDNMLFTNASDYELLHVANFNVVTGALVPVTPTTVAKGKP